MRRPAGASRGRNRCRARRARTGRRPEPVPFPSPVQARDRAYAQGLRRGVRAQRVRQTLPAAAALRPRCTSAGFNSNAASTPRVTQRLAWRRAPFAPAATGADSLRDRAVFARRHAGGATERGVCAITLGDDPEALLRDLQDRFPRAQLRGGDVISSARWPPYSASSKRRGRGRSAARSARHQLSAARLAGAARRSAGTTVSYAEIARRLGIPRLAAPWAPPSPPIRWPWQYRAIA